MSWHDKNYGKSPFDPDYLDDYDPKEDYDRYREACEEKASRKREE